MEDERREFLNGKIVGEIGMNQPGFDRTTTDRSEIESLAIVRDIDFDRVFVAPRFNPNATDFWLPGRNAILRCFETMIDRVTNQMEERLTQTVENRSVEFELGTEDLDLHSLAEFFCDLPRCAREIIRHPHEWGGAQLKHTTLQFCDATIDAVQTVGDFCIVRITSDTCTELARA